MKLKNWLRGWLRSASVVRSGNRKRALGRRQLGFESLEDRTMPSAGITLSNSFFTLGINADGSLIREDAGAGPGAVFHGSDFLLPGSPVAEFTVAANGTNYTNGGAIGTTQIPTTLTNISSGSIQGVVVTGTVTPGLQLTRTIEFNNSNWSASGGWVTFTIQLTNTGSSTFSNVAYVENDDPDNDYDVYGQYDTINNLVDGGQLLLATGPSSGLTMGLGSVNSTSVLGDPGDFDVQNPFTIIGNANDNPGDTDTDTSINQAFNFGSLAPGQTATGTYEMVFGTSAAEAETLFGASLISVTGVSPNSGPAAGGTSVTITGTNFTGATAVHFGATAAPSFTVNSSSQITAIDPSGPGLVDVTVTVPSVGTSPISTADEFTYLGAPPLVSSVSPAGGSTGGGTSVVITGNSFNGATAVYFGGTSATSFTVNSDTQITAVDPAGALGTVDVTVANPYGTSTTSSADQFSYANEPGVDLTATSILDSSATITINGANFSPIPGNDSVAFNLGVTGTVTAATATQLTVSVTTPPTALGILTAVVTTDGAISSGAPVQVATEVNGTWLVSSNAGTGGSLSSVTLPFALANSLSGDTVSFSGSMTIDLGTSMTIAHNLTLSGGGSSVVVDGLGAYQPFYIDSGVTASISNLTIEQGDNGDGGAVSNYGTLTLSNDTLTGNEGTYGGAVYNDGTLNLNGDTFSNNVGTYYGGAIDSYATVNATDCTFNGNSTDYYGGAECNFGGTSTFTQCTFFGNSTDYYYGGAIYNDGTSLVLDADTISGNTASVYNYGPYGGGIFSYAPVTMDNTIVAGNTGADAPDIYNNSSLTANYCMIGNTTDGAPNSGSHNILNPASSGLSGSLAYNGGSTETLALVSGSPALGTGDPSLAGTISENLIPLSSSPDIGAWQVPILVTSVSPNSGPAAGGTTVTITGSGFTGATAVDFGPANPATILTETPTQITCTAPAGPGLVDVTVTTPALGSSGTSTADEFTYLGAPPLVSGVSPAGGSTGGGTSVVITGNSFNGATAVYFGGTRATSFTVNSDTQITAIDPGEAAGTVNVTVVNPYGTSTTSSVDRFTYSAPVVTSVNPPGGIGAGGTSVTITGNYLLGATAVYFGSTKATSFVVNSNTQITAVDPAEGPGSVDVTVATPYATSTTSSADQFIYSVPVVASVTPASGTLAGGTSITITGANFTGATAVYFGLVKATSFVVNSNTQITAVDPAEEAGNVNITVVNPYATSAISTADQFTYTAANTFNVPAGSSLTVPNGIYAGGSVFNVGANATVTIDAGTFTGGCVFNVASGAVVNLTAGGNVFYSGTLTGSGSGTVELTGGRLSIGVGGLTFDFPGAMFQWVGGSGLSLLDGSDGDATNLGTMNLSSNSGDMILTNYATLYNYGTLIQTGTGNLGLASDGAAYTTLDNEPGAYYLLESNSGIDLWDGGITSLVNAGTIRKTAGSGTSQLQIVGPLTNTGTIESDIGTLYLDANSITQISGTSLTGGTWNAVDGAHLQFPSGTAITTNEANLTLSGSGASISGIAGLTSNTGTFVVTSGASFTTTGSFTNSSSLTVGPSSIVTVGSFTQTSTGALDDQLGGTPGSGLFGQLHVTGTATLAGSFNLALVSGFSPSSGQTFAVMSFASATGAFTSFNGLSPFFTESLSGTGLSLVDAGVQAVDLAATSVTAPTAANVGQSITVNWQATDLSSQATTGNWQDSVYLSPTPTITGSSTLLGMVPETSTLAGEASYSASLTAALPAALAPGYYYVLVQVDSLYQLLDPNRVNNTLAATTGQINISLPTLTLGTAYSDSFTAANQNHYYQITVPAGGSLNVALQSSASSGSVALYISQGTLPAVYDYQEVAATVNQPNQTAVVPQVLTSGTYYILAHSVSGAAATAGFTVTATQTAAVTVTAISPYSGGNAGNITIEIDGNNFTAAATASLTLGGHTLSASSIDFVSASQMFATFNLTGAAVGNYTLTVHQGAQSVTAAHTFQVVAASSASLNVVLLAPTYIRAGRTGTVTITYTNETDNDIVAPLLDISSTNASTYFSTADNPNDYVQYAQVLAVASSGPAGILRPGEGGQLTFTLLDENTGGTEIPIQVNQIKTGQTINWAAQEAALQPVTVPNATWNTVFGNVLTMIGSTTDSYNAALAQEATYLSSLGETTARVSDVGTLWSFLVAQADAELPNETLNSTTDASLPVPGSVPLSIDRTFVSSIEGRSTPGMFGLGWTSSWQTSLSVDASGAVTINFGGGVFSYFALGAGGTYLNTDGGFGSLTKSAGVFTYTEVSGTQYVFLATGQLKYEQDTNGNRITLGYNGEGQIATLSYSNPSDPSEPTEQLSLTYNAQGFVSQVADGTGNVWTYTYDAAGHLLSVKAPGPTAAGLTTSYTYDTSVNAETMNALLSITSTNGSQQNFTYDALGRLSGTSANGGTEATTYSYLGEGEVEVTDANGDQTITYYNHLGQTARVQNPLGGISTSLYNDNDELVSYTNAAGDTTHYTYDQNGNLSQTVNPLGQTVQMTYNSLGDLTSLTDANGNTTQYSYGSTGNLLSITYPDGTQQSFTYNPLGDLSETVEQNGDAIAYQYNTLGQTAQESFADGSYETFSYDAHGNMLTALTFSAAGTLTGTTTMTYNAANQLTSISYPGGLSLAFTYNALDQRIRSVDQTGYTINYSYDSLGRLAELTDGSDNLIVQYTYNSLGQLHEKLNGNGTSTTYTYDADGNLVSEINYAGGSTVNSSFTYTFNVLNEMTSMTDASGNVTTYGYDTTGQLTSVTLPGGQTITYVYNAAGDRTEVISAGTSASYSSNSVNEITQAGQTTYTYDANGDMTSMTDASGTTLYTYNALNQLVSIAASDGTVTTFQYSPLGFLVGENVNGTQTNFLVDPSGLGIIVSSYNGSGSLIADYNYGISLVSQTGPSGTGYYDFDGSGNTIGMTGSSGVYVNRYSYLPFGETTTLSATLPNPFEYAGKNGVITLASGLDLMRARVYVVSTGQFASNDPLNIRGGDTDDNVRRYAQNSPLIFIDPRGLDDCPSPGFWASVGNGFGSSLGSGEAWTDAAGNGVIWGGSGAAGGALTGGTVTIEFGGIGAVPGWAVGGVLGGGAGFLGTMWSHFNSGFWHPPTTPSCPPPPNPNPPPTNPGPTGNCNTGGPDDPNALDGPAGSGTQGFIQDNGSWAYTVQFENDGNAAAQDVTVTEQLDPNLDWSTFQLGSFGFGPVNFTVPTGLTQYQTTVSYQNSVGTSLHVEVLLDFNVATGLLTVNFVSLDPITGQAPTGVFDGFLYPESESPIGSDGYVQYTVQPNSGLTTGTTINQQAAVVFDTNAPLNTGVVTNTIDAGPPTSSVAALPATENTPSFTVSWSGNDDSGGSGIASYAIYYSDNGGPYQLFTTATAAGSAIFTGQDGHTYSFYSVATDNVNNVQTTPTAAQATTLIQLPAATDVTSQVNISSSGLGANRHAGTLSGTIGITNTSNTAISGGLILDWTGMASAVSVQTVSVTINGQTTQLTVTPDGQGNSEVVISSQLLASLSVGQTITLNVVYSDPTFAAVNFLPDLLSNPSD